MLHTTLPRARWRTLGAAVVAALALLAASLAGASPAQANDAYPCHSPKDRAFRDDQGLLWPKVSTMRCPLWRGNVPVHAWSSSAAPVVGHLVAGGSANWFVAEKQSNPYRLGGAQNNWWASTMADNGRWGWVSEVYFRGGGPNENDAGLLIRPSKYMCAGKCGPIPPWWR